MSNKEGLSRRDFLKTTGIATGAVVGGGLLGGLVGYNVNSRKQVTPNIESEKTNLEEHQVGLKFFSSPYDFKVLSQVTERIFPEDELGPGAIGLGVPFFIDNQLAGNYGSNAREYMLGPFFKGAPTQGYQSSLTRAEMFRQGITLIEDEAQKRFQKRFTELEGGQMDEVITAFQKNEVEMKGVESQFFFKVLRMATLEGAYADPIYNGNLNMDGWRMKGFPGHQGSYLNDVESDKFMEFEPQSVNHMGP